MHNAHAQQRASGSGLSNEHTKCGIIKIEADLFLHIPRKISWCATEEK